MNAAELEKRVADLKDNPAFQMILEGMRSKIDTLGKDYFKLKFEDEEARRGKFDEIHFREMILDEIELKLKNFK